MTNAALTPDTDATAGTDYPAHTDAAGDSSNAGAAPAATAPADATLAADGTDRADNADNSDSADAVAAPAIRGHRAPEVLPEVDVAEIAGSVYDFLSSIRRLMERPNQKLSITQSEIEALQFVAQHPGCGASDIARLRFLRASNVSATVRRLIGAGLIVRRANPTDKRAQDLFLSDAGVEMMNAITDEWAILIARATSLMEARDIAKLRRGVPALRNLSLAAESLIDNLQHER